MAVLKISVWEGSEYGREPKFTIKITVLQIIERT